MDQARRSQGSPIISCPTLKILKNQVVGRDDTKTHGTIKQTKFRIDEITKSVTFRPKVALNLSLPSNLTPLPLRPPASTSTSPPPFPSFPLGAGRAMRVKRTTPQQQPHHSNPDSLTTLDPNHAHSPTNPIRHQHSPPRPRDPARFARSNPEPDQTRSPLTSPLQTPHRTARISHTQKFLACGSRA